MKLVFATNNKHKIEEVQHLLKNNFQLLSLAEINCNDELSETGTTLEENALQKARYIYEKFQRNCFADDTGLEIEALNGKPGVFSARYAGEERSASKNIQKVLQELKNTTNRNVCFKTIISLIINNIHYLFEGKVHGKISHNLKGENGFGYDPIFIPDGFDRTFAEMTIEEKNKISHRSIAVNKLAEFLNVLKINFRGKLPQ